MANDSKKSWKKKMRLNVILGLSLLGGLFSVLVDFDHIPLWLFNIRLGWHLPNILWSVSLEGRNLHTIYVFVAYAIILSLWLTPLVVRLIQPKTTTLD